MTIFDITLYTLLGLLGYIWFFWVFFVLVMGFYRAHLLKKMNKLTWALGSPFIIFGIIADIFSNIVIAPFVFFDLPREPTVTGRLKRYHRQGSGWRYQIANFVCQNMLDIFDPTGDHC